MELTQALAYYQQQTEIALANYFNQITTPNKLKEAMIYSCLGGGKRLRAVLVYGIGTLLGAKESLLNAPACAIECIHAYSLIHDDLPAMDNSPLRRGKATCHLAYDEATAILAGDALQTFAFEIMSSDESLAYEQQLAMIKTLATASGANGMAGGQTLDILAENQDITLTELQNIDQWVGALGSCFDFLTILPTSMKSRPLQYSRSDAG